MSFCRTLVRNSRFAVIGGNACTDSARDHGEQVKLSCRQRPLQRSIHLALARGTARRRFPSIATAGEKKKRDTSTIQEVEVTSGTSTQPPSPLGGATTSLGRSPLPDDQGKKGAEPSEGGQPGLPESDPEQPMHAGAHMVLVLTTTLVHLAVLGSGALFASWRAEDQVSNRTI